MGDSEERDIIGEMVSGDVHVEALLDDMDPRGLANALSRRFGWGAASYVSWSSEAEAEAEALSSSSASPRELCGRVGDENSLLTLG